MGTLMKVKLYTDGACSGNPGPGGYGFVLQYVDPKGTLHEREESDGFEETTNNRMELTAVIEGLKRLNRPCQVTVYSDSQYLVKAVNEKWLASWLTKDFRRGRSGEVKNIDLWEELLQAMKMHTVEFVWVKGHAENEVNNRCDKLAVAAYRKYLEKEQEPEEKPNTIVVGS